MRKLLVVDDSRFVCEEIEHQLEGTGYKIVAACKNAEEAIQMYHEHQPDIVLMDIVLPGIDGLEATGALRGKWPEARIVIISSLAFDDTVAKAKEAGAAGVVFKPFTKEDLLAALNDATISL